LGDETTNPFLQWQHKELQHLSFKTFSFDSNITAGIKAASYTTPTPIQAQAMPIVMQGRDVMGLAQTGTGKTAAFVLPILDRLMQTKGRSTRATGVRALIIAPTRELAEQIHQSICVLGAKTGLRSVTVFGGVGIFPQVKALRSADIVVACPGRLLDHIQRKTVNLSKVDVLVLDEADQMFDMGFLPDIRRILAQLPSTGRQTLLFSATMPGQIRKLADDILTRPVRVKVQREAPAETVSHAFYPVAQHLKAKLLLKLLGTMPSDAVLVFTRTKHRAKQLGVKLAKAGYRSTSLQGNLSQAKRQEAMGGFKSGKYQVLVATDIAARGIDVANVSHVINFDMPDTPQTYIHRIGRTGRAERSGEAFTLITDEDRYMVKAIHSALGKPVDRRVLEDFNYSAAAVSAKPKQAGSAAPRQGRRPQQAPGRRAKPRPKSQGRSAKGAFDWMSAKQGRRPKMAARPAA
jgi:ATP-dependent RNA helicase RhlE